MPGVNNGPLVRSYRVSDRDEVLHHKLATNRQISLVAGQRKLTEEEQGRPATAYEEFEAWLFAGVYLELEPEGVFVLDDGHGRAVGHIVTTCDTKIFMNRLKAKKESDTRWQVQRQESACTSGARSEDKELSVEPLLAWLRGLPFLDDFPGHLHMAVDQSYQNCGHGGELLKEAEAYWRGKGIKGAFCGPANDRSRRFYESNGWQKHSSGACLKRFSE